MKKQSWTLYIALRWFKPGKNSGPSLVPAAAGIAVGVAALLTVMAVMNGFQKGFIDAVLELDSFHLRSELAGNASFPEAVDYAQKILKLENGKNLSGAVKRPVITATPFIDIRTLVSGSKGKTRAVRIKIVPDNIFDTDPGFAKLLQIRAGHFGKGLCLGSELARQLNLRVGDTVSVLQLSSDEEEGIAFGMLDIAVSGIYNSGYYEFDSGLAFIDHSSSKGLGAIEGWSVGLKLHDRFADMSTKSWLEKQGFGNLLSWRVYNRSFFGALRMEKTIMIMLIGLIFVVVGVNIFHSMRKTVFNRTEDIATLKAVGANSMDLKKVFILDGLTAGVGGASAGLILGLLFSFNINSIFGAIEKVAALVYHLLGSRGRAFEIFSPSYFYITRVPVSLVYKEVLFIALSGALSAVLAALAACSKFSRIMPSEVLRNE